MHKKIQNKLLMVFAACSLSTQTMAASIDIFELSSFINATELGSASLRDTRIGSGLNEFGSAGLTTTFVNSLDADNLGAVSWNVTNTTGADLNNVWFSGFFDASIDELTNGFFNEQGNATGLDLGTGTGDSLADSWEIDEPGFIFGDIYTNLIDNMLDNSVGFSGLDDVALALGFNVGSLLVDETLVATFEVSTIDNGGLFQYDPDSDSGFYFTGSVIKQTIEVTEPKTLALFGFGLIFVAGWLYNRPTNTRKFANRHFI